MRRQPSRTIFTPAKRSGSQSDFPRAVATTRTLLDAKGDQRLIPIIVHKKWEDKEVANVPITREYIRAKSGKDAVEIYNAWVNQYEFQRPMVAPPDVPQDRLQILRKAFKATLEDPEFLAEPRSRGW